MAGLDNLSPFGRFGFPPADSPLSALVTALIDANSKPRNRSEWEARFVYWQKPASDTE